MDADASHILAVCKASTPIKNMIIAFKIKKKLGKALFNTFVNQGNERNIRKILAGKILSTMERLEKAELAIKWRSVHVEDDSAGSDSQMRGNDNFRYGSSLCGKRNLGQLIWEHLTFPLLEP